MSTMSGWCITKHHDGCVLTITYYDKTWVCSCACHSTETAEALGN